MGFEIRNIAGRAHDLAAWAGGAQKVTHKVAHKVAQGSNALVDKGTELARGAASRLPGKTGAQSAASIGQAAQASAKGDARASPMTQGQDLATRVRGTQPQDIDRDLVLMANDAYTAPGENKPAESGLKEEGWVRVKPDAHGNYSVKDQHDRMVNIKSGSLKDSASGFDAAIYEKVDDKGKKTGQYVVAYAGTDPSQRGDLKADTGQGIGVSTAQYNRAVKLAQKMQDIAGPGNVAFTGHSLGGGLAAAAVLTTHETGVTFNAAGLSNESMRDLGYSSPNDKRAEIASSGALRSYSVDGDPLTTASVLGAPEQLGTPWHVSAPAGVRYSDLSKLHGGKGKDQLYVAGVRDGHARPGIVVNPLLKAAVDAIPFFGDLSPAQRNTAINLVGNGLDTGKEFIGDLRKIGNQARSDLSDVYRHPSASSPIRAGGILADAAFDTAGSTVGGLFEFGGKTVTTLTDGFGAEIRSTGRAAGLDLGSSQPAAKAVENFGNGVRDALQGTGSTVESVADKGGDAIAWGTNHLNPLKWF